MKSTLVSKLSGFVTKQKGLAHGYNAFFKLLAELVSKSNDVHTD